MAAKILSVTFTAATIALVKAAFDTWAAGGYVVCFAALVWNGAAFDMVVLYYA